MAEAIPSRGSHFVIVPLRNDVVPQQDAVECSGSRLEIGAIIGEDDLIDHGVDRWVFDANPVGCRRPVTPSSHVIRYRV